MPNIRLRLRKWFSLISIILLFFLGGMVAISLYMQRFSAPYVRQKVTEISDQYDAVIVLGAKVYTDGRLSWMLKQRADLAIQLWRSGTAKKILVSGDNRSIYYHEVTTIQTYLLDVWIPEDVIVLDYAGLDTYDSMYRAREVFDIDSLLIPTQRFHLPRALYIARKLGIDAIGIVGDDEIVSDTMRLSFREFFAQQKARWDIWVDVSPDHLTKYVAPEK